MIIWNFPSAAFIELGGWKRRKRPLNLYQPQSARNDLWFPFLFFHLNRTIREESVVAVVNLSEWTEENITAVEWRCGNLSHKESISFHFLRITSSHQSRNWKSCNYLIRGCNLRDHLHQYTTREAFILKSSLLVTDII